MSKCFMCRHMMSASRLMGRLCLLCELPGDICAYEEDESDIITFHPADDTVMKATQLIGKICPDDEELENLGEMGDGPVMEGG